MPPNPVLLNHVRDFKIQLKSRVARLPPQFISRAPTAYPEKIGEFKERHGDIYAIAFADGDPAPSRYTAREWDLLISKVYRSRCDVHKLETHIFAKPMHAYFSDVDC